MEERHNALNAMRVITATGQGAVCHSIRDAKNGQLHLSLPQFLHLGLGDVLDLFLHRGKQVERNGRSFLGGGWNLRQRNGGLFARRLPVLLIYL